jgi:hypothetical protein
MFEGYPSHALLAFHTDRDDIYHGRNVTRNHVWSGTVNHPPGANQVSWGHLEVGGSNRRGTNIVPARLWMVIVTKKLAYRNGFSPPMANGFSSVILYPAETTRVRTIARALTAGAGCYGKKRRPPRRSGHDGSWRGLSADDTAVVSGDVADGHALFSGALRDSWSHCPNAEYRHSW